LNSLLGQWSFSIGNSFFPNCLKISRWYVNDFPFSVIKMFVHSI
jgi:hypothetical protein